eukprot:COSAG01_NODE_452_length_16879_cov_474.367223_9_plen_228_part_00
MAPERKRNPRRVNVETDMYSVGVVLLLTFAPKHIKRVEERCVGPQGGCMGDGNCDCAETRAFQCTPAAVLLECREFMPSGVAETLQQLLADRPEQRPQAREVLEGKVPNVRGGASRQRGYFAQQNEETPAYWTDVPAHDSGLPTVVPITDLGILQRLTRAMKPTMPEKFGHGLSRGLDWRTLGFESQETGDGSHRLVRDGYLPGIEVKKAWRLQNKQVWNLRAYRFA